MFGLLNGFVFTLNALRNCRFQEILGGVYTLCFLCDGFNIAFIVYYIGQTSSCVKTNKI